MRSVLVSLCLSMTVCGTGCLPPQQYPDAQSDALRTRSQERFRVYVACMQAAATEFATSSATPTEVSAAAQSKCGGEYYGFAGAVDAYFVSIVSSSGVPMARQRAQTYAAESRTEVMAKVVQWVIEKRMPKPLEVSPTAEVRRDRW